MTEQNPKKSSMKQFFWPTLSTHEECLVAIKNSSYVGFFSAGLTVLAVAVGVFDSSNLLDAIIAIICSVFVLLKKSRAAAVMIVLLFFAGKIVQISEGSFKPNAVPMTLIIGVTFINGVRATYALRKIEARRPSDNLAPTINDEIEKSA